MSVTYSAFGELRVTVHGVTTSIRRRRERQVLATLLAARHAAVPADRLATDLWGAEAGPAVLGLVQVAVSRLRSLIEPDRPARGGTLLVSTTAGYLLRAAVEDVDVWRYEDLARRSLGEALPAAQVVALCEEASRLWAVPYAGADAPAPQEHAERLRELRTDLLHQHGRALLDLGSPDAAVRLLSGVVEEHPYREVLWRAHALAQYRSGRQADALETLRRLRRTLGHELGVDPVPETLALEEALLRQDEVALSQPLLAPSAARAGRRPSRRRTPLVGRAAELATGVSLLQEAVEEQQATFVLVAGEPGIGKSAWLRELAADAEQRGFEVLVGHNYENDLAPELWPWIEVVRSVLDEAPEELQEVLRPIVSDAGLQRRGGAMLPVYEAVLGLLADRALRRPLLVVIEDLSHADTATLRLLRHVADAGLQAPLVIAGSRRTTVEPNQALLAALAALSRAGLARVRLDGLPVEAVGQLITSVAGPHERSLDEHVAALTGGNPLFVRQYAALLAEQADLTTLEPASLTIPQGVRAVLRERISLLPEQAVPVLLSASVLGHTISPELLASLLELSVEEVLSCLDVGVRAGLLVEEAAGYAFVHALAVDTAYGELSSARRIRLHDRASRVLEERTGAGPDTVNAIASHAWAASGLSPVHRERAATWRARAADQALGRHAYAEALERWRDVLASVPSGSQAAALAHHGATTALLNLSRVDEAQREIELGTQIARALGAWELVTELACTQATMSPWSWPHPGADQAAFSAAIDDALPHVSPGSRALLLVVRDIDRLTSRSREPRGGDTAAALELARRIGAPDLLGLVLLFAVVATDGCLPPPDRLELALELLDLHPEGDMLAGALFLLGLVEWDNLHPQEADRAMARSRELAHDLGFSRMDIPFAWWDAVRARDLDADDAGTLLDAAVGQHLRAGFFQAGDAVALRLVRRDEGSHLLEGLSDCPPASSPEVAALVAHALLEAGEPELARDCLGAAPPPETAAGTGLAGQCLRLLVLAAVGTAEEVREALAPLEDHRGRAVTVHNVMDHCGVVDHFLAAGYAALGDPRAAVAAAAALAANEALGCGPWARRSAALVQTLTE